MKDVLEVENSKNIILRKIQNKHFIKLSFKQPPSVSYLSHRWISTESRLFTRGLQNFRCFSTKIQQKLRIKIFRLNLHFVVFLKILFLAKQSSFPDPVTHETHATAPAGEIMVRCITLPLSLYPSRKFIILLETKRKMKKRLRKAHEITWYQR